MPAAVKFVPEGFNELCFKLESIYILMITIKTPIPVITLYFKISPSFLVFINFFNYTLFKTI